MKLQVHIYWRQHDWEEKGGFIASQCPSHIYSDENHFFIKSIDVEVGEIEPITRDQVARAKVAALESERQEILAESHKKVAAIEEKIRQLSALTYEPQGA